MMIKQNFDLSNSKVWLILVQVILTNTFNMLKTDEAAVTPFVYSTEKCNQVHTGCV